MTTTDDESTSLRIRDRLIESGNTSCVKIYAGCQSRYFWEGAWRDATEYVITALTLTSELTHLTEAIRSAHNYVTPEIVARKLDALTSDYEQWVVATLDELGETRR
jgi:periplasmic divalent cation tolerance protein